MLAASLTASSCGSSSSRTPAFARADTAPLVALAQRIAREEPCAQRRDIARLQRRALALVNARRVPGELQESLLSGVNALAADSPPCVPAVPPAATPSTTTTPPPAPPAKPKPKPKRKPHDHHEHHHGHGKHD